MSTAEINVLSAGAVAPGLAKVIDAFRHETGHEVKIAFATAPAILKRVDGETPDVVIAPPAVLDELVKAGKATSADRVTVGRIGVGLMVRGDAPLPMIGSIEELKQSLLTAKSVVYNQASTGIYLEKLFERLGIGEHLKTKTVRYPDAGAVLEHICKGKGDEIGFGATTVIIEGENKGLKFVGPLPPEIQNYTPYAAVLTAGSTQEAAREFVRFLTGPVAQKVFAAAGIQ